MFADNALAASELFFKTSSMLSFVPTWPGRPGQVPALAVARRQFPQLISTMLLQHGYSVEVYTSSKDAWSVSQQGSPGNLGDFEELATGADPHLAAVMGAVKMTTDMGNRVWSILEMGAFATVFPDTHESYSLAHGRCIRGHCKLRAGLRRVPR